MKKKCNILFAIILIVLLSACSSSDVKTDEIKKAWFDRLIEYSNKITGYEALKYELRDGVRLMYVASDFENYMLCLGWRTS